MSTPRSVASGPALAEQRAFAEDVAYYLVQSPRQLPSRYLYDDLGSALFEAICRLPWYGITRTEHRLLSANARAIFEHTAGLNEIDELIELGPGNGGKLATLLRAADLGRPLTVHLVDISPSALAVAVDRLTTAPGIIVRTHENEYEVGIAEAARHRRSGGRTMVLCLGSNIGNFDPPDAARFLRHIRASVMAGDALLIGTDLVKPEPELMLAYDDPLGVTAAFNRNLLVRANRELGANFDVDAFAHRAVWNAAASRVEMHLVSARSQTVHVRASRLHVTFAAGEAIWTESSYKYRPDDVTAMLARAGFSVAGRWIEDGFALTLAQATAGPPL